jgi:hypothetical protein
MSTRRVNLRSGSREPRPIGRPSGASWPAAQVQWVAVVIFARQLAGKHLRAFLTSRGEVEGEDIHDLVTLFARCSKLDPSLVFMAEDCERLARWKPSYPGPTTPEPTESEARAALDIANRVCDSIRERVLLDGE